MDEDEMIEMGPWGRAADGGLEATCTVTTAVGPPQVTVARIDAPTLLEVGLSADGSLEGHQAELDRRARRSIAHLLTTGRVSPVLRLSALDLQGVVGEDPPDDGIDQPGPEA